MDIKEYLEILTGVHTLVFDCRTNFWHTTAEDAINLSKRADALADTLQQGSRIRVALTEACTALLELSICASSQPTHRKLEVVEFIKRFAEVAETLKDAAPNVGGIRRLQLAHKMLCSIGEDLPNGGHKHELSVCAGKLDDLIAEMESDLTCK